MMENETNKPVEIQRMATLESIAAMQQPLYDAIADLKVETHEPFKCH